MSNERKLEGIITKCFPQRGYCFIRSKDAEKDVFLHISKTEDDTLPTEGDIVEFILETERNGRLSAIECRVVRNIADMLRKVEKQQEEMEVDDEAPGEI